MPKFKKKTLKGKFNNKSSKEKERLWKKRLKKKGKKLRNTSKREWMRKESCNWK